MTFLASIPSIFSAATTATAGTAAATAGLGTALSIGGSIVSTVGAISKARQASKMASANIAAIERERQDKEKRRLRASIKERGAARARMAASGIDLSSESPMLALDEIIKIGEEDINAISAGAEAEKRQEQIKRKGAIAQGTTALLGGAFDVGSTLLSSRIKKRTGKL